MTVYYINMKYNRWYVALYVNNSLGVPKNKNSYTIKYDYMRYWADDVAINVWSIENLPN